MQITHRRFARLVCVATLIAATAHLSAQAKVSKAEGTRFVSKLAQIQKNGETPRKGTAARSTQVSDGEVNSYLKFQAGEQIPVGIVDPTLHAAGNGRITGRALVDLDAVRTSKKRAWTDPLGYLTGKMPITAAGMLTTSKGIGRFQLESAEISGVTIPKSLVQELLSFYSKTKENPAGINMDDPFTLPSAIQEIRVGQGTAVIIQ